ncbi:carbohydrate-binding, CenC-like protein [Tanacetum coccineum]
MEPISTRNKGYHHSSFPGTLIMLTFSLINCQPKTGTNFSEVSFKISTKVGVTPQSKNASIDIWVDSVSLQPFTQEEWKSYRYQSIEKIRKSKVKLQEVNSEGKPLANRTLTVAQKFANFPFGCAINRNILANSDYQNWFLSRFKYTTFENEMKWYTNERIQNQEDYSVVDALLEFTKSNEVQVRGYNVFWENPK